MIELANIVQEIIYWLADLNMRVRILTGWNMLLTLAVAGLYLNLVWRAWRGRS